MYDLVSVVVHCGLGPNRGHYICIVKTLGEWVLFDDDVVEVRQIVKFLIHSFLTAFFKYMFHLSC